MFIKILCSTRVILFVKMYVSTKLVNIAVL